MTRTLNFRRVSLFVALPFFMLSIATTASAQNIIVNGDFEAYSTYGQITAPSYTDYQRVNANYVVEAGHYVINSTTSGHGGGQGWPNPSNSHGKYMIVNGYGGNSNPSKVVWRQTVNVSTQTNYTVSYRYVNLNRVIYGQINPSKLQVKINGTNFGGVNTLPTNNDWHDWNNNGTKWNSGNATQAIIEIYDTYTGNEGMGDDFCIDDISFIPDVVYSVDAVDDWDVSACQNVAVDIDVLGNDIIQPNSNDATVTIVTAPTHGTATVLTNKKIRYTFSGGNYTTDQLKYRVTNHSVTDDAWVHINTNSTPQVGNITAPGPICTGGVLGIQVPSVNPSATGQWEYSSSQNGSFQTFDPNNIPLSMNGKWVRYSATNGCGEGHSNAVQITVTNGPSFSGQTPQIQPICAGQSLTLTPPAYNANGSQILSYGWVASPTENGEYTTFNLNNISATYNGWYIRYMVEGSCGYVYSTPARQLTVNVAPSNVGALAAPDAICAGDDLDVTAPTFDGTGTGAWEISQTANGTYQSFNITNVPRTYDGWYLHYKVSNNCGSATSNAVQIHVNDAPTIATPATPTAICAGGSFNLVTPTIQANGATITDQGWQIAASQNGNYNAFNNNNVQYTYNHYWIRYFAENDCGTTYSPSVQVTVNDIPLVGNITTPAGICAGQSFSLTTPSVTWRHTNQGTGSWEIQINGTWQPLTNSNIPFDYNGCSIRYKAVNGCGTAYSSNTAQVTVYSTEPTYEEITACDTYIWNGITCDHTGDYQAQVQNANGCTITAHLHFIMSDAYTETQSISECESYIWPVNGQTYYASCTDTYTIVSGNPLVCDSIFTLDLTINNAPVINGNLQAPSEICSDELLSITTPQYQINHNEGGRIRWDYATSPNGPFHPFEPSSHHFDYNANPYYIRFAVINGCDSTFSNVVQLRVNGVPEIVGQLSAFQVCENNPLDLPDVDVVWRNTDVNDRVAEWQMANTQNGTYGGINPAMIMQMSHNGCWIRYYAHTSCGTDIIGPVPITVLSAEDQWLETIVACDAYELPSGEVVTESCVVDFEVYEPCFHIVHQPFVINYSDYVIDPITSCHDEYVWHGRTFYRSEQTQYAWDTLQNVNGCDSIVELNLDFGNYSTYTHNRIACGSYEWEMNPGHIYYESVRDSVFVPAVGQDDCDTWYYLELTLGHDVLLEGDPMTECSGFVWHGVAYYEDAVVYDSLQTAVTHCDSIISHQLNIIPLIETDTSMVSCQPMWWNGHFFEEEGDEYTHVFISQYGCDSIVTMHFSLSDELFVLVDHYACEPFNWYEHYCSEDGQQYSHTFTTPQGCDSTVMLTFHLNEPKIVTEPDVYACDSYSLGGIVYEYGVYEVYHDTVYSTMGHCDSIVHFTRIEIRNSDQIGTIAGGHDVYAASNLISGIYRYEIDMTGVIGDVEWSISNPDWQIVDSQDNYCRVLVATPGSAVLTASFNTSSCGALEKHFEINAAYFGIDEHDVEVNVYPNPTKGTVTIEAESIESIRLSNMMGQVLDWVETDGADSVMLNLNSLAPSIYLLEIKTINGIVKRRVVVCR